MAIWVLWVVLWVGTCCIHIFFRTDVLHASAYALDSPPPVNQCFYKIYISIYTENMYKRIYRKLPCPPIGNNLHQRQQQQHRFTKYRKHSLSLSLQMQAHSIRICYKLRMILHEMQAATGWVRAYTPHTNARTQQLVDFYAEYISFDILPQYLALHSRNVNEKNLKIENNNRIGKQFNWVEFQALFEMSALWIWIICWPIEW